MGGMGIRIFEVRFSLNLHVDQIQLVWHYLTYHLDSTTATVSTYLDLSVSQSLTPSTVPFDDTIREGMLGSMCICLSHIHVWFFAARKEYTRMADALAQIGSNTASGKPFLFSLCQWGWVSFIYIGGLRSIINATRLQEQVWLYVQGYFLSGEFCLLILVCFL